MKIVKPKKAFIIIYPLFCECSACKENGVGYSLRSCPFCGANFGGYVISTDFDSGKVEKIKVKIKRERSDLPYYGRKGKKLD